MKYVGVLTGDIVRSTKVKDEEVLSLITAIDSLFEELSSHFKIQIPYEIWRGDSFQALITDPTLALKIAILFRVGLRSRTPKGVSFNFTWDARIGIGVDKMSHQDERVSKSNGTAFVLSGQAFDKIHSQPIRLSLKTANEELNDEFETETMLADAVISNWTVKQSEAIYLYWLGNVSQTELSKKLNLSQPALHKRINEFGRLYAIDRFNNRFVRKITAYVE